jgi:hypothetical protein
MGKMVRAGAGARIFDKLEPEPELDPHKNGPAPQHCTVPNNTFLKLIYYLNQLKICTAYFLFCRVRLGGEYIGWGVYITLQIHFSHGKWDHQKEPYTDFLPA